MSLQDISDLLFTAQWGKKLLDIQPTRKCAQNKEEKQVKEIYQLKDTQQHMALIMRRAKTKIVRSHARGTANSFRTHGCGPPVRTITRLLRHACGRAWRTMGPEDSMLLYTSALLAALVPPPSQSMSFMETLRGLQPLPGQYHWHLQ